MCIKWKELKGTEIWTCTACESANEELDKKVKKVNAKVEEMKKDLRVISDKQDQSELREQLRDTKVDSQAADMVALRERLAKLEASSGDQILREVEERKNRESNLVFYRIPEVDRAERVEVRKQGDEKRVRMVLEEIGASSTLEMKFSRRIGERQDGQEARPLVIGFDSVQARESVLERSYKLSQSKHEGLKEVTIVPDLTSRQRKDEQYRVVEIKKKNLARSVDEQSKNLFYKVVGRKGSRREILASLLPGEYMDKEGLVVRGDRREGREGKQATGSNSVPVAGVKTPLVQNSPMQQTSQRQVDSMDREQDQLENSLSRSSPGGNLGSQVLTNGRRPSVSQEAWTPAGKRKGRGSKGSPEIQEKRFREGEWSWGQ